MTDSAGLRRLATWALISGLCAAAAAGIVALLTGSFDDTDWKVIGSSLGFSVFSATGAAGAALRLRRRPWARVLGTVAVVASLVAFVALIAAVWVDYGTDDDDLPWRAWGIAGLVALCSSHASLVLGGLRPVDSAAIRALSAIAIVAITVDSTVGILALLDLLEDIDSEEAGRALGALLILALLCTALPPILRRSAQRAAASPPDLAAELGDIAERLHSLPLPPEARGDVERLRALARSADQGTDR